MALGVIFKHYKGRRCQDLRVEYHNFIVFGAKILNICAKMISKPIIGSSQQSATASP